MTGTNNERGYIVAIGGAENKLRHPGILRRFVELCGGRDGRIVVIPTASQLKDTGDDYRRLFLDLGAGDVEIESIRSRSDCARTDTLSRFEHADGVFFTGGDQRRLGRLIGPTPLAEFLIDLNAKGLHIAGTSAGAAFLSARMIIGGKGGTMPRAGMVHLTDGLGLLSNVIIDQHFRQRNRFGRLLAALSDHPELLGLGVDEDTAAFIGPRDDFQVEGSGAVTVVDTSQLELGKRASQSESSPLSMIDLKVHILAREASYDLSARCATI